MATERKNKADPFFLASETLAELEESERINIKKKLYEIFEKWKNEHGVYPPRAAGMIGVLIELGLRPKKPDPEPAKAYIERQKLIALEADTVPKHIEAWECDSFADTPVKLFYKLKADNYEPITSIIMESGEPHTLATAMLLCKSIAKHQCLCCNEAAFRLAEYFKEQTKKYKTPALKKSRVLKENHEKRTIEVKATKQEIHSLASQFLYEGKAKSNIVSLIHKKIKEKISKRQIRRHLEDHPSSNWISKNIKKK
ncbi:MAG: hypothetical protein IPH06_06280 [Alphaproteobacteria bacterium]|nr:hypothetical protein [Alphaproteobacteria bacterium]QQS57625.1 MAG: hypothetical protein IPN28_02045 [Alphaproteobacteria bacterium]